MRGTPSKLVIRVRSSGILARLAAPLGRYGSPGLPASSWPNSIEVPGVPDLTRLTHALASADHGPSADANIRKMPSQVRL